MGPPFRISNTESGYSRVVPAPRDPIVTAYIRQRLKQLIEVDKIMTGAQAAARAGVSPATISNLRGHNAMVTGVGSRSIHGLAVLFGFLGEAELREAAWAWWQQRGSHLEDLLAEEGVQQALSMVRSKHPDVTDEKVTRILTRFAHPDFLGRDAVFWLPALNTEIEQDLARGRRSPVDEDADD